EGTHTGNTSGFQSIGDSRGVTQHMVCTFCSGDHFTMNCIGFQQSLQAHNTDVARVSARQSASNTFSTRASERTLSGGSRSSENLLKSPPVSLFYKISKEY
ncbi:hypothetical protein JTE90_025224, partial [Oedothorax gibbosus]